VNNGTNEERFLAVVFGQDIRCYPYIWREKNDGENEIWVEKTGYPVQRVDLIPEIQEVLATLGEKPKRILNLRFGLEDGRCWTQKEIGKEYHVSGARIGQIIQRSLYRLRHPTRSRRLKELVIPSPEERFREKQRSLILEAELKNRRAATFEQEDEKRLDVILRKVSDDYQQKYNLTVSPYGRIHNALRRLNLLRFSDLENIPERELRSLRGIGSQSLEVIKKALQAAEQEAPP